MVAKYSELQPGSQPEINAVPSEKKRDKKALYLESLTRFQETHKIADTPLCRIPGFSSNI
jgi:hypothetical protein